MPETRSAEACGCDPGTTPTYVCRACQEAQPPMGRAVPNCVQCGKPLFSWDQRQCTRCFALQVEKVLS